MKQVLYILFGWALASIVSWCSGKLLLRRLSLHLSRQEEGAFAFLTGLACLSSAVFLLAALHLAYRSVFLGLSVLVIAAAWHMRVWRPAGESLPPVPPGWKLLFVSVWLLFGCVYFIYALAPEASPDGMAYHLALVARYAREHGFTPITNNIYANLPQGMEMLFLFAFVWGRHSAAALVHCTCLLVLPWLILNYGRRIGMPAVGAAGGLLIFLAPVAGIAGVSAYNDVAIAAVAFAVFALLDIWGEQREDAMLVPVGLLAGFAFAIKYTGFIAAPYALVVVGWSLWRWRKPVVRPVLLVTLCAAVLITPTLAKNWIVVQNPVSPFLNRAFPNPYVHVSFEEGWSRDMRSYEVHSPWELAYETTVNGYKTAGLLGPVFLLAPVSLLALRRAPGRRLLLGALVFLLLYPLNLGTRFLLPAATFLAPAMAMGVMGGGGSALAVALHGFISWPARNAWHLRPLSVGIGLGSGTVLAALVLLHAFLSWPGHIGWYSHRHAWRIEEMPVLAALRLEPEDEFLSRRAGDAYSMVRFIEKVTPPGSRIFSLDVPPAAYCAREFLTWYYSALTIRLNESISAGFNAALQPLRVLTWRMNPQSLRGLRLVETASTRPSTPAVNELRIFGPSGELQPVRGWHLDAHPFPWDAGLAFDRNPATRWDARQQTRAGAWVEADFGKPETITAIRLETTPDQAAVQWMLEGETAPDKWSTLQTTPEEMSLPAPLELRRAAVAELKRNNIGYLLVDMPSPVAEFHDHAAQWGIRPLGEFGTGCLYLLE